jgi:hypothetical protein
MAEAAQKIERVQLGVRMEARLVKVYGLDYETHSARGFPK